jgi:hypothetical protein
MPICSPSYSPDGSKPALHDLVEQGVLTTAVEATGLFEQYRDALAHANRPGRDGKILFVPAG